jgi:hypothetical protein
VRWDLAAMEMRGGVMDSRRRRRRWMTILPVKGEGLQLSVSKYRCRWGVAAAGHSS